MTGLIEPSTMVFLLSMFCFYLFIRCGELSKKIEELQIATTIDQRITNEDVRGRLERIEQDTDYHGRTIEKLIFERIDA